MPKKKKLPPPRAGRGQPLRKERAQIFVTEYVAHRNATKAAIAAGYSEHSAAAQAYKLLRRDDIKKMVSDLTAEHLSKVKLQGEQAMLRIQTIGVFDTRRIFDKNGCVLPPSEWPDDVAQSIAGFEVRETFHSITGKHTGYVKKVKFKDGLKALEDLSSHLGVLKTNSDTNVNVETTVVNEDDVRAKREKIKTDC